MQSLTFTTPELTTLAVSVTPYLTTELFFVFGAALVVFLILKNRKEDALTFGVSLLFTSILVALLKIFFAVPRPTTSLVEELTYSFPSGHASATAFLAVIIPYLFVRNIRSFWLQYFFTFFWVFFALFVGWSRIAIQVHRPEEVLAGFALGSMCALTAILTLRFSLKIIPQELPQE